MTKISLRVYNREIEGMTESGQVDEAIAHCQYILKTFPMHLETYRLLGKAFLESRRYGDAADIFQRVLMSVPEDFVSHVGMSIIRDDENKLDEAIWHMERAFEVQPSNPAIQDELRKLYGRRDGVQPPKVRLTRDALANMYAQGALYSQAIAEIRAVLADDPNRPDLQVMLARAYSKDGRKKQAIEICTELIKKYPYCFDALRILIDLMPPSDQHEFTQTYRLRVRALDPYAGFVTGSIFNSDNVPDAAVNIELLDYDPNDMESGSQPAWASSLGIKLEPEKGQEDVPEWLSEKTNEIQPISEVEILPTALEGEIEASSEIEDVPDWMRSSGWEKTTDQTVKNSVFDDTELENDQLLAKAEIPEWLKGMAPDEELLEPDKLPDGFESMLEGNSINSSLQDDFKVLEQEPGLIEDVMENDISEKELPDWMKEGENIEPIQTETESTEISQEMEPDQDAITLSSEEIQEHSEDASGQPADDISSWLGEVKRESFDSENDLNEIRDNEVDLPDWLKDIGLEKPIFDIENADEPLTEIPIQSEEFSTAGDQIDPEIKATTEDELPEWLKEIDSTQELVSPYDELASTLGPDAEISSLLDDEKDTPDLLESMPQPEGLGIEEEIQVPTGEDTKLKIEPVEDGLPSLDDQDAAMAWLESLAARQGAKSEELLTKPEDRLEEPPEWVKNSIEDELKSVEDEAIISIPTESKLIDFGKTDEIKSIIEEETEGTKLTIGDEQPQVIEENGQEDLVVGKVIASTDLGDSPETTTQYETENPFEFDNSVPDIQPTNLVEELSLEDEDQQAGFTLNQDHGDSSESEMVSSSDIDNSKWLTELEPNDADNSQDPIAPKISEFYGKEISDPLPDWLKDMEKDASASEWISESEELPENIKEGNKSEIISDERDIDDIGEIFPTDTSNWNFEDSESEPGLEPLGEVVKPVSSGEWLPLQSDQEIPAEEIADISQTGSDLRSNESPQISKLPGTGMLSKIPAKDIEKEAGTLERAQSFIESGEINQAINVYARLVKKGQLLEGVIHDLRETTYRYPVDIGIWQLLGDAYMRANRLQDALDAYTKAEELLR